MANVPFDDPASLDPKALALESGESLLKIRESVLHALEQAENRGDRRSAARLRTIVQQIQAALRAQGRGI